MSKNKEELKHFEKLNISSLSINKIKELIKINIKNTLLSWKNNIDIDKQTFHIIGPAGIGKTEICFQIAQELSKEFLDNKDQFYVIKVTAPVVSKDVFIIPFPIIDSSNTASFKMLYSDFIPKNKDSYGIFVIDELSRGDHELQQLMWQIQNEGKIHLHEFPKKWFVVSTDNPDDQEYSMDYIQDAAGLRRSLHVYVDVSPIDFINHGKNKKFHPSVLEFIGIHMDYLYDFKSQKVGAVYSNPASWERVSNILIGYEQIPDGIKNNLVDIEFLCSGLINTNMARLFCDFLRNSKDISPKDIVSNYPKVRKDIVSLVRDQNNAKLGEVMNSFLTYLITSYPTYGDNEKKNITEFLTTIPIDTAALFVTQLNTFSKTGKEFLYVTNLHRTLIKEYPDYKNEFYSKLVKAAG